MDISNELVDLVVSATNKAIPAIQYTNGPLLSFIVVETADGMRGEKDYPQGTTDEDIVEAASMEGVQRFALLSSGSVQTEAGSAPVLLIHAAERGDPAGYVFAQRFVSSDVATYGELDGQIDIIQVQQNHFKHVPYRVSSDPQRNAVLLQESLVRFAKRMMGQAFGDPDPRVLTVALTVVEEAEEADASFAYVHEPSQTNIQVTLVYRENMFLPVSLSQIAADGYVSELREDLRDTILGVYKA